jgi:hypothetical protein
VSTRGKAVRFASAVVVALAVAGTAAAARRAGVRVPQSDLELEAKDGELVIRKGLARARLQLESLDPTLYPDMALGLEVRAKGDDVTAIVDTNCQGKSTLTFTRATLEARLELAAAEAHAAHKRWDVAADGFARAAQLDPDLAEAATSLAVAQAKAGRERDAVATLMAAGARHRVWVIWRAIVDRSLAHAASDPEVRKLWARTHGHATLRALQASHAAYSTDLGVVVWDRAYSDSMSDAGHEPSELRVIDAATGKLVARLPYRRVSPRAVDQALAAMGFETGAVKARDLGGVGADGGAGFRGFKGHVPGSSVSVVVNKGRVRLNEGAHLVGEAVVAAHSDYPSAGAWVATVPGGVLVGVDVNVGDGCGAWGYDDVVWMRGAAQAK